MTGPGLLASVAWGALAPLATATEAPVVAATPHALAAGPAPALDLSVPSEPFGPDDLLWMEVRADGLLLTESLTVYASRLGVYAPLGELSRVLDLAVGVFPAQRRAEGWVLSPERRLTVDLESMTARADGRDIRIQPGQATVHDGELYVRLDLLEQLLPLKARADTRSLLMTLDLDEPFPAQQRAERERRRDGLGRAALSGGRPAEEIETPYRLFSPPAFDVNLGGQAAREAGARSRRFDLRAAGDLLYGGLEAYAGSDDDGRLRDVRLSLSRKDPDGRALGSLGGTRAAVGDVYAPSMAIGAAGYGGRGVAYSSAPLDSLDMATPLDLRGELAAGEEVELYVNEVLTGAQAAPVQGRYEFLNVPLTYGLNTIRLVFYGPQGRVREQVRRVNFGAGQVAAGQTVLRFGLVEQGRALIEPDDAYRDIEAGGTRAVAAVDYGVTPSWTVSAGVAHYAPRGEAARTLGSVGARGALGPAAVRADLAFDDQGGRGLTVGAAGRPQILGMGLGLVVSHSEYAGGFADETRRAGLSDDLVMTRASDIRLDGSFSGPGALTIPFVTSVRRIEFADDRRLTTAEVRASTAVGNWLMSNSLALEDERRPGLRRRRLVGAADLAAVASARAQLRAGVAYEIRPEVGIDSAYVTADVRVADAGVLRFGAVRSLDARETNLHAAAIRQVGDFDVGLTAAYETRSKEWRLGLQINFSLGYDPLQGRYRTLKTGAASGGAAAVNAWVDENMDGVRQPHEPAVPGLSVVAASGERATDARGHALAGGLGDGGRSAVRIGTDAVADPFLAPVRGDAFVLTPRPGRTAVIDYPLHHTGEVELSVGLERPSGPPRPLSALAVRLMPVAGGEVFAARSDHAGTIYLEGVPPGEYLVVLDPAQADGLGLALAGETRVTVPAGGGFVRAGDLAVRLTRALPE